MRCTRHGLLLVGLLGLLLRSSDPVARPVDYEEMKGEIGAMIGPVSADDGLTREGNARIGLGAIGAAGSYWFAPRWQVFGDVLFSQFDSAPVNLASGVYFDGPFLLPLEETIQSQAFRSGVNYRFHERLRLYVSMGAGWTKIERSNQLSPSGPVGPSGAIGARPGFALQASVLPGAAEVPADVESTFVSLGVGQRFPLRQRLAWGWEARIDRTLDDATIAGIPGPDPGNGSFYPVPPERSHVNQVSLLFGLHWGIGNSRRVKEPAGTGEHSGKDPRRPALPGEGRGAGPGRPAAPGQGRGGPPTKPALPACGETKQLTDVQFEFDSAELKDEARQVLSGWADLLRPNSGSYEIGGHTCEIGSDSYNQQLSERRARSVEEYLESKGVPSERLTSVGYGKRNPIADNTTEDGRVRNRRVEVRRVDCP
jgi:outer membrane protein OmpA-like peptidoglycan-associated protein